MDKGFVEIFGLVLDEDGVDTGGSLVTFIIEEVKQKSEIMWEVAVSGPLVI